MQKNMTIKHCLFPILFLIIKNGNILLVYTKHFSGYHVIVIERLCKQTRLCNSRDFNIIELLINKPCMHIKTRSSNCTRNCII